MWSALTELRNAYAHAGARPQKISPQRDGQKLEVLIGAVEALLTLPPDERRSKHLRLVITSLGMSAGLLYTVLRVLRPDAVICVTSRVALAGGKEALERAHADDPSVRRPSMLWVEIDDPHAGFREIDNKIPWDALAALVAPGTNAEADLNITGGTSVLQYCAEFVAQRLSALGIDLRKVAAVDRRHPDVQREEPFVVGEILRLDAAVEVSDNA